MVNIKKFVIDYLEGRVDSNEFIKTLKSDSSIFDWLQSMLPNGTTMFDYKFDEHFRVIEKKEVPYNVSNVINGILTQLGETTLGKEYNLHCYIARLFEKYLPMEKFTIDKTLEVKVKFLLEACPEYLDSVAIENSGVFEKLMEQLPESMPKTKRIKEFRKRIKEMFYVEGQKYPRWIQESEWPLSKTGKPTKFLRQKSAHNGEVCYYYFLDVDTQEEIEVMQAY